VTTLKYFVIFGHFLVHSLHCYHGWMLCQKIKVAFFHQIAYISNYNFWLFKQNNLR